MDGQGEGGGDEREGDVGEQAGGDEDAQGAMRGRMRRKGERDAQASQDERGSDQGHPGDEGEQQEPGDECQRHRPDLVGVQ